ncbi:tRNA (adenosine(37)-N6)-threonylcarbamoyltransferase complex dimerization subunit type 1 TsaB [Desulfitobacterium chlororespirans]|uniref:tRNA threonylcarbamoyladenosine biosynthesis protein TsaB n=1 Tax=Desulfitobacterium chlororespirans DSM 11544 TaxID=1121395 RepID=A0A1M7T4X6_9FIRM|nr:tRNA (adenosine(37)-N6)-threonylcarbamoyltransferase complex dimerization subunit type 1 TsaB [Desulfitobacterium chlororespirans]SHN65745.1 tRNA threonylcarbamoyladenosine biosynthesis protein TsaB [Desulfitobacterium chlororespirans DSM 11544]
MKYLTIDTTTKVTALALADDGQLVAEGFLHTSKTHSERLIPVLDQVLEASAWNLQDLDFIGVVRGPGSFTGIRIGIATAQGLAQVLKLPLIGVLSLDSLAWAGHSRTEEIVPILDARKNEWYTAQYQWSEREEIPIRSREPFAVEPALWLKELAEQGKPIVFVGDAVSRYQEKIKAILGDKAVLLPDYLALPRGAYTVRCVWNEWQKGTQEKLVEPYYIRLSEAETNWAKKEEAQKGK